MIYCTLFLVLLLPCWQRLAGQGGSWYLGRVPQMLSALACTLALYPFHQHAALWLLQTVLLYLALETGHGVALGMGKSETDTSDDTRTQRILPIVILLNNLTKFRWQSREWCLLYFAVKGFLIGLCMLPMGLLLAILWPLCYGLKTRWLDLHGTTLAEYCTGFALMLSILANALLYWSLY